MWPWGHAAVGYLLFSVCTRLYDGEPPGDEATLALAVATQLPDLIDKPLAYSLEVIPEGRSLAHSLLIAIPLCFVVWYRFRDRRPAVGVAFVIGYFSHLLADSYNAILAGRFEMLTFLLYPLMAPPDYPTQSFARHWELLVEALSSITLAGVLTGQLPSVAYQGLLALGVVFLWIADGTPGIRWLLERLKPAFSERK